MVVNIDRIYPVVVAIVLAGVTFWLDRITRLQDLAATDQAYMGADFIAEQLHAVRYNERGSIQYTLLAEEAVHYPYNQMTDVVHPRLVFVRDGQNLQTTAKYGEVRGDGDEVFLTEDVLLIRDGLKGEPPMTLTSNSLTVWPDTEQAASDEPVVLTKGESIATGDSMRAENLYGILKLMGSATVHMPSTKK